MATLPQGLTTKDLDRYAYLDAGIKKLQEEHKTLNAKIKKAHQDAGITGKQSLAYQTDKYGTVLVELSESKRFDSEGFSATFPFDANPNYYVPALDQSAIPADLLADYKTIVISNLSIKVLK